jgi:hypothetical protein
LPGIFDELRFGIKEIGAKGAAVHEQLDDTFGARWVVSAGLGLKGGRKRDGPKTTAKAGDGFAAGDE